MTSRLCLLVLLCTASHVLGQGYGDDDNSKDATPQHGWGGGGTWGHGGWGDRGHRRNNTRVTEGFVGTPHFCQRYFNVLVNETTYPNCPPGTSCRRTCSWTGWWRSSEWICTRDSCCDVAVSVMRVEQRNMTVCCPGFTDGKWGSRCSIPICLNKCTDIKTTCVGPDICGPACYPACNNGTCQIGTPNNTCTCTKGWTGPTCDMEVQCTPTGDNVCDKGTCNNGRCFCDNGYYGILCDKYDCTNRCLNDGTCTGPDTCTCVNGFTGDNCETAPGPGVIP